jgi:acetyl-CoA carboxylase biotin carboxyl carrier protein
VDLVKDLIKAFEEAEISKMKIEMNDLKLEMEKEGTNQPVLVQAPVSPAPVASAPAAPAPTPAQSSAGTPDLITGTEVKSPLVGTFYRAPSPDAQPFVQEGDTVKEGQTLCIIEAMKVMNEIKAPCNGKVARIVPDSGDMVEFDQMIMIIEE